MKASLPVHPQLDSCGAPGFETPLLAQGDLHSSLSPTTFAACSESFEKKSLQCAAFSLTCIPGVGSMQRGVVLLADVVISRN